VGSEASKYEGKTLALTESGEMGEVASGGERDEDEEAITVSG
jgi:hypothetical protein